MQEHKGHTASIAVTGIAHGIEADQRLAFVACWRVAVGDAKDDAHPDQGDHDQHRGNADAPVEPYPGFRRMPPEAQISTKDDNSSGN